MKEKNKKMIVIVTSLLLVVGVSLAYFTASVLLGGDGTSVTGSTTTIQDSTLIVEGTLEFNDLDIYPGHQSISSIKVTATGNNELIPYNLIWKGTNTLNTPLNYTVYKTSSSIEVSSSCEKKSEVMGGAKIYYEECTISNLESLGSHITEGTITTSEAETRVELIGDEFITSTQNGTSWYYYVILEYPNLEESQNIDMGGTFNGEITIEESDAEPDINIIAAYIEQEDGSYEQVSDIPQSGYILDTERSTCSNGAIPSWTNGGLFVSDLTKSGTSCYLYFKTSVKDFLLKNYSTILSRNDFSATVTETTTGTIYKSLNSSQYDNDGEVYYFAGNPTDNWVQFGGFYWRIIRINGDGSIRLIYSGDSLSGPVTNGEATQIGTSAFNGLINNNMYVGYMYENNQVHGFTTSSTIKMELDNWYEENLQSYADKISIEAGFCGDREPSTSSDNSNGNGGIGEIWTHYGAYIRLVNGKNPTFKCQNDSDLYTVTNSSHGNHALAYPIGLITADDIAFAGGVVRTSNGYYYLNVNSLYWTISPWFYYGANGSTVFNVNSEGSLVGSMSNASTLAIRPVINLRNDVELTGSGISTDPYVVVS